MGLVGSLSDIRGKQRLRAKLLASGGGAPPVTRNDIVHLINNDAARTWYNYPNIMVRDGLLGFGSVSSTGSCQITKHDGVLPTIVTLNANLQIDDHNEPTLLVLPSGKLLAAYSKHSADGLVRHRVSTNAWPDISSFASEKTYTDGGNVAYTMPFLLSDNVPRILTREGGGSQRSRRMAMAPLADVEAGTATFALSTIFLTTGERPYLSAVQSGPDRLDFLVSNGHPNEVATSLYHVYMQLVGGVEKFYKSDGTEIVGLPINIVAQGTLISNTTGGRCWNDKIAIGRDGQPRVLYTKYPTGATGAHSANGGLGTTYNDIEYWHGRWTGPSGSPTPNTWVETRLLTGQKSLYPTESFYAGGMCFDGNDVTRLGLCEIFNGIYEFKSYSFDEATGTKTLLKTYTNGSATHNIRPQSPVGASRPFEWTWLDGVYTSFTNYQTKMRGAGAIVPTLGTFTPAEMFALGEKGAWWDPSDFSTMFQDVAGTIPVTATGQSVARINDKSGNGYHLLQATAANRPVPQQDGNGKYYLLFDGTNDGLSVANFDMSAFDGLYVCAGVRKLSDAGAGTIFELSASSSSTNGTFALWAPSTAAANFGFRQGGTTRPVLTAITYAQPITAVVSGIGDISDAYAYLRVNGATVAADLTTQGTGSLINSTLYVGSRAGSSNFLNGRFYGGIIRAGRPSNDQIAKCEAWMNSKTAAY